MNSVMNRRQREGSETVNIQEICKKFESPRKQLSSSESELQSSKRFVPSSCSSTQKCPSQLSSHPRIETQWSKGRTQHYELMQKRQMEKQHLEKNPGGNSEVKGVNKPVLPVKPRQCVKKLPSNGTCKNAPNNLQTNLVKQRTIAFESCSPTPQKSLVHLHQNFNHSAPATEDKSNKSSLAGRGHTHCKSPTYFQDNPTYDEQPAPKKPPRTFAHNRYIENRAMQPSHTNIIRVTKEGCFPVSGYAEDNVKPNLRFDQNGFSPPTIVLHKENMLPLPVHQKLSPQYVFSDYDFSPLSSHRNYGTLKRSFSEEHVYADPYETMQNYQQARKLGGSGVSACVKPYEDARSSGNLHYKSSSILNINKCSSGKPWSPLTLKTTRPLKLAKSSTPNVRDILNNTFGQLWKKLYSGNSTDALDPDFPEDIPGDSGSEVSVKDVQERLIYVRSLKKKLLGPTLHRNSEQLFDGLAVACLTPARKDSSPKPRLIFQYPKEVETVYQHTMLPQLCFPDAGSLRASAAYKSETFQFSVEDEKGCKTFGYCLRLLGSTPTSSASAYITLPAVICLLTSRNATAFYMKVLSEIEKHLLLPESAFHNYVSKLYQAKVPPPGEKISLPDFIENKEESSFLLTRPGDNRIVDGNLTLLLQRLEVDLLLKVISSLLLERKVILVSSQSSTLFKCTSGVLSLLYPLSWQHSCIPVLPTCLLAQCLFTSPYLYGILSSTVHKVLEMLKEKVLIIDLDQSQILREFGDEHTILPNRVSKTVRYALSLAQNMTDPTEMMRDLMIAESLLRMFVELLGHSEQHIVESPVGSYMFGRESFCKAPSSKSIQMFLQWFSETQMFEAFIEERMELRRTQEIRNQPGLNIPVGLYDRRLQEYCTQQSHGTYKLRENVRELGKKVKTFGEKLKKVF